jgi:membrane-associated protein
VTVLGYFLGNVAFIRDHVEAIFLLIVFISILPGISAVAKKLLAGKADKTVANGTLTSTAELPAMDLPGQVDSTMPLPVVHHAGPVGANDSPVR